MKKYNGEKAIISLTSWKARINTVGKTLYSLIKMCPGFHIVLVLSKEEFPQKEKELQEELMLFVDNDLIEILWVYDNIKAFKKVMPTMEKYKDVPIVSADDDLIYNRNYAEELYREYLVRRNYFSISYRHKKMQTNCGPATIYNPKYYNLILSSFNRKFVDCVEDDMFMQYVIEKNKLKQKFISNKFPYEKYTNDEFALYNIYKNKGTPSERKKRNFKEFDKINESPIIINITTWTKRDYCLYPMLKHLQKQTLKPDKIILWLSHEEYDYKKLPENIQKCIDEKLLTEVMWVDKNTYCHKRFECFKYFNDCYNIFMDDDILYEPNFIKEIVECSKKHQNCITVYSSNTMYYKGYKVIKKKITKEPSHYNAFMGGRCCFPPYIITKDVISENIHLRDKYVTKCDESWLRPFLIRHDIKIYAMHDWDNRQYSIIKDSQENAVWIENFETKNGIREKERNFFNAIKIVGVEDKVKELWPDIGIDRWKLKTKDEI